MKFEVLKRSYLKRNIIIGVLGVAIISTVVLNFTRAKYRVTESIPLVNGTINYTPYDFKVIAMYQENDNGEYTSVDVMPSGGYVINEEKSYCTLDGKTKDENAILKTIDGNHTIANLSKKSKCYLYFDELAGLTIDEILANKVINTRTNFDNIFFSDTTGTMFEAEDNDGKTYYFAGSPRDNWVFFAGFYWRIIRINGDGSIRIIYNGTTSNSTGVNTHIQISTFNNNDGDNMYVGYLYEKDNVHGSSTESTIKGVVDRWYITKIGDISKYSSKVKEDGTFCINRSLTSGSGLANDKTVYGKRNNNPSYKCENKEDIIKYPVGLISMDELWYAGGTITTDNTSFYLYNGQAYWTMSPCDFGTETQKFARVYTFQATGRINGHKVTLERGVRPVINLRADVILTGSGTTSDPYTVVET